MCSVKFGIFFLLLLTIMPFIFGNDKTNLPVEKLTARQIRSENPINGKYRHRVRRRGILKGAVIGATIGAGAALLSNAFSGHRGHHDYYGFNG
ncbi:hypothetical protein niasHT_012034 [Heterodera trifolii]|uniref:Uncharacterized protein n=1 Tax=Heterodera trifolii TaxID=157864 RepID=A0ABD2KTL8_9BILA